MPESFFENIYFYVYLVNGMSVSWLVAYLMNIIRKSRHFSDVDVRI